MDPTETTLTVALCVASAFAYALGAVWQQRLAYRTTRTLVRLPGWWMAIGLNAVGAVLHVVALAFGPLVLVQSFGVLTIAMAVHLGAVVRRRSTTHTERVATTLVVAGLLGLLLSMGSSADAAALSSGGLLGLLLMTVLALTVLAYRSRDVGAVGGWPALAGGLAFGVSSAVTQTVAVHVTTDGLGALLRLDVAIAVLAIAALSVAGIAFVQRSYRSGLGAPLAVSNITNPVTAAAIGILLLGQNVGTDANSVSFAIVAALAAGIGVHLLSSAPNESDTVSWAPRDAGSIGVLASAPVTTTVR